MNNVAPNKLKVKQLTQNESKYSEKNKRIDVKQYNKIK